MIVVDGNVYSTKGCAMDILEQAEATVKGDVSGNKLAIWMDNSSKLQALGKISSNDVGILLSLYGDQGTGELELGTIDAQTAISINYGEYKDIDKILAALPEMTVYKMNADTLLRLYTESEGLSLKEASNLAEKILMEKLQYAIRKQDTSNGKINIADELTKAKEGQTLTFSVVANDGYEVDSVSGAFMLIPRTVLNKVGLFDESIFMYAEDIDLCYRIKERGYKVVYYADVSMTHLKGQSGLHTKNKVVIYHFHKGIKIFYDKYYKDKHNFFVTFLMHSAINLRYVVTLLRSKLRR